MKYELIKRHNEVVSKDDITYHLGDFMFTDNWKEVAQTINKLNGTHILILGNHDFIYVPHYVEAGFQSVHTSLMLEDYLLVHDPAIFGVKLDIKGIHGHIHQATLHMTPNCYNVSVEMSNYYPVSFNTIKEYFDSI